MKNKKMPTPEQVAIAHRYSIPDDQIITINLEKVRAYERNPYIKLHKFLDDLDERRLPSKKRSFMLLPPFRAEEFK